MVRKGAKGGKRKGLTRFEKATNKNRAEETKGKFSISIVYGWGEI